MRLRERLGKLFIESLVNYPRSQWADLFVDQNLAQRVLRLVELDEAKRLLDRRPKTVRSTIIPQNRTLAKRTSDDYGE